MVVTAVLGYLCKQWRNREKL